jgi:type IV secretory pathway TrbD component
MDRLSLYLTLATGPVTVGGLVIAALTLGYYSWPAIAGAAALGLLAAWPLAYLISRRIKRRDPDFDHTRAGGLVPDPQGPEV